MINGECDVYVVWMMVVTTGGYQSAAPPQHTASRLWSSRHREMSYYATKNLTQDALTRCASVQVTCAYLYLFTCIGFVCRCRYHSCAEIVGTENMVNCGHVFAVIQTADSL